MSTDESQIKQLQSKLEQAHAKIRELEAGNTVKHDTKFKNVINASPVPYALNDEDLNITYLNPAFIRTFGYDLTDIPTLDDWWPKAYPDPEYRDWVARTWMQHLEEAKRTGDSFEAMELDIVCKDNSIKTVLASAAALTESYLGNHLVILYDITDRKRTQVERDREINQLIETLPLGLALCDMNGKLVQINQAYADIIGYSIDETLELTYWDVTPKSYAEDEQKQLQALSRTGNYGPYVKEYIHKNGHRVPVQLSGALIQRAEVDYIWSVVEDISQRLKQEEEMLRHQKMEAIGQLTGGIAHDFNNMLSVIIGFSELLDEQIEPDKTKPKKYTHEINNAAKRAQKLTSKLLDFSRKTPASTDVVDINAVIHEMGDLLEKTLTRRIKFDYQFGDDLWKVKLDKARFVDAILNVCINAKHAMSDKGTITITTANRNQVDDAGNGMNSECVELQVSDSGCGMTDAIKERVFEPFYTTKGKAGTGLGLSQVYGFVQQSGGAIGLESTVDVGTSIILSFPRYIESGEEAEPVKAVSIEAAGATGKTILVVDDELLLLDLADEILSSKGYKVLRAENAEKALLVLNNFKVDLMLSDVIMPGMDGYQLATKVEALYPETKIQMVSGFSDDRAVNLKNNALHESRLMKPYSSETLLNRISKLLSK